jgi:hypothetical protein
MSGGTSSTSAEAPIPELAREAALLHPILVNFISSQCLPAAPPSEPQAHLAYEQMQAAIRDLSGGGRGCGICLDRPHKASYPASSLSLSPSVSSSSSSDTTNTTPSFGLLPSAQADLVALFILCSMAIRRPRAYLGGKIKLASHSNVKPHEGAESVFRSSESLPSMHTAESVLLYKLPADALELLDVSYLMKKFNFSSSLNHDHSDSNGNNSTVDSTYSPIEAHFLSSTRLMDIVRGFQLVGVKKNTDNYVNTSLFEWSRGSRPLVLLFYIPTPMEVSNIMDSFDIIIIVVVAVVIFIHFHFIMCFL